MALSVGVLGVVIVDTKPVVTGAGVASVKGSARKAVSEVGLRDTIVMSLPFLVGPWLSGREYLQSGHVDQLALLHMGGSSALVPCIFAAKRGDRP